MKLEQLVQTEILNANSEKDTVSKAIEDSLRVDSYNVVEINIDKPWGAYFRISSLQAEKFIHQFFPGLTLEEAQLGVSGAELSPKILLVSPSQRLSWQYHDRRAERWTFLTEGAYNKSVNNDPGDVVLARSGDVVQFLQSERHRLVGGNARYTVVAEIWQHTDISQPSDEDDIVRLIDDYQR